MAIDLYCSYQSPACRSVAYLAKALGLQLNFKRISPRAGDHKTPEFLKMNPQHSVPTLVDDGFVLWESHAILGYLVNQYAKDDSLYPKDPQKRATVDQRLHFVIGTLESRLMKFFIIHHKGSSPDSDTITAMEEALSLLDKFLEGQDWIAGSDITIADYSVASVISFVDMLNYDISKYQNIARWFAKSRKIILGQDYD